MLVQLTLIGLCWLGWLLTRHMGRFPVEFARLLDHAEPPSGFTTLLAGRSHVSGEFQERAVTLALQLGGGESQPGYALVSMKVPALDQQTSLTRSPSGTGDTDRDLEHALSTLEDRYQLKVTVEDG